MYETMRDRLERLLQEEVGIHRVDTIVKCKTRDGLLYTLGITENHRKDAPKEVSFAEWVESNAIKDLLQYTEALEQSEHGFITSMHELVTIRKTEIARIWVELGDCHVMADCKF